jgi:hypothetical protein
MSRFSPGLLLFILVMAFTALLNVALAEEQREPRRPAAPISGPSADAIAALVRQLRADKLELREQAAKKLTAIGRPAIPAIVEAAEQGTLEISIRCIGILKALRDTHDRATQDAAIAGLEKLMTSSNATAARLAADVLNPPVIPRSAPPALPRQAPPPPGMPAQRFNVRVQHKSINGAVEVNVDENGTHVEITHRDGKNIAVKITRPADDDDSEPEPETFEAPDAAELKDKYPEAHEWYEKYGTGGRGAMLAFPRMFRGGQPPGLPPMLPRPPFPIQPFGGQPIPGPQFPIPRLPGDPRRFGFPGAMPGGQPPDAEPNDRKAAVTAPRDELKRLADRLRTLAETDQIDLAELHKISDQLQKVRDRLAESQADRTGTDPTGTDPDDTP